MRSTGSMPSQIGNSIKGNFITHISLATTDENSH